MAAFKIVRALVPIPCLSPLHLQIYKRIIIFAHNSMKESDAKDWLIVVSRLLWTWVWVLVCPYMSCDKPATYPGWIPSSLGSAPAPPRDPDMDKRFKMMDGLMDLSSFKGRYCPDALQ